MPANPKLDLPTVHLLEVCDDPTLTVFYCTASDGHRAILEPTIVSGAIYWGFRYHSGDVPSDRFKFLRPSRAEAIAAAFITPLNNHHQRTLITTTYRHQAFAYKSDDYRG